MRFLASFVAGLVLAGWVVWRVSRAEPTPDWVRMPPGFTQPMLALEFARTPEAVGTLLALRRETVISRAQARFRDRLRHEVRLDEVFLFLYTAFLTLFSLELGAAVTRPAVGYLGAGLAVFVGYCDGLENEQLLSILTQLETGRYGVALHYLTIFTGLKWGALSLLPLVWMPALWQLGTVSRILFVVAGVAALLGGMYWLPWDQPRLLEVATLALVLFIGSLIPYAGLQVIGSNRRLPRPTWL